jgi:hypothetical protein
VQFRRRNAQAEPRRKVRRGEDDRHPVVDGPHHFVRLRRQGRARLGRLAAHLAAADFFLSAALTAYQDRNGLDDAGRAALLGCDPAVLVSLRLCRRPGAAEPDRSAEQDVADIVRRFGIELTVLRRVVRTADAPAP